MSNDAAENCVPPDRPSATWAVHRQDDNGNRFVVRSGLGRIEAHGLVADLESRGHKQLYWAEPDLTYAQIAHDNECEAEALDWCESSLGDIADDRDDVGATNE